MWEKKREGAKEVVCGMKRNKLALTFIRDRGLISHERASSNSYARTYVPHFHTQCTNDLCDEHRRPLDDPAVRDGPRRILAASAPRTGFLIKFLG